MGHDPAHAGHGAARGKLLVDAGLQVLLGGQDVGVAEVHLAEVECDLVLHDDRAAVRGRRGAEELRLRLGEGGVLLRRPRSWRLLLWRR